jgi:hypothetical protein
VPMFLTIRSAVPVLELSSGSHLAAHCCLPALQAQWGGKRQYAACCGSSAVTNIDEMCQPQFHSASSTHSCVARRGFLCLGIICFALLLMFPW